LRSQVELRVDLPVLVDTISLVDLVRPISVWLGRAVALLRVHRVIKTIIVRLWELG
jgi:hypothetical protein